MGGGASKPKKVPAERVAGSAQVLSVLESDQSDEDAAATIAGLRKIDAQFKMNLMYHEEDGWNLLHVASSSRARGDRPACVKALLAHKCDVNAIASGVGQFLHNHNGKTFAYVDSTPLMFASQHGRVETMRALLEGRANINMRAGDGGTALHVAAAHLQLEAARLLIDSGIDGTITSGIEATQPRRRKKKKKRKPNQSEDPSPRNQERDSDEEEDGTSDAQQVPQSSTTEPPQYGSGLTAAQVAAATRDAAVVAQDLVDFSLEGFALCGKMKDEVDLAEEMCQLLSSMKVVATPPSNPAEELGVEPAARQQSDTSPLDSDEEDTTDEISAGGGDKEEEIGQAMPAS